MGGLMGSPEPIDQNVAPAEEQAAMLGMREEGSLMAWGTPKQEFEVR